MCAAKSVLNKIRSRDREPPDGGLLTNILISEPVSKQNTAWYYYSVLFRSIQKYFFSSKEIQ